MISLLDDSIGEDSDVFWPKIWLFYNAFTNLINFDKPHKNKLSFKVEISETSLDIKINNQLRRIEIHFNGLFLSIHG